MAKIGIVSFTDPRSLDLEDVAEQYLKESHEGLVSFLENKGHEIINPHNLIVKGDEEKAYGICSTKEVKEVARILNEATIDGLIIGCWKWTDSFLPVRLVKDTNVPTLLYTSTNPEWSGATMLAAVGASLHEVAPNKHAIFHKRIADNLEGVGNWADQFDQDKIIGSAYNVGRRILDELNQSSLLLWGGSYCLRMDVLQDDIPKMKSFLIGDVIQEDTYMLISRAEKIIRMHPQRIYNMEAWLRNNGANIQFDDKMVTDDSFRKQLAFYLAARDRLKELKDEDVIGVSIRCQPELSVEYGVTACALPAFLPYASDAEGDQTIMPTVCEGDIKGLWTLAMLHKLNPNIPPLFGDLKFISDDYFIISNCGASSIYYANNSLDPKITLPYISIKAQCQGESGAAFGYRGKEIETVTVARLSRMAGKYKMQLGLGHALNVNEKIMDKMLWGAQWPHVAIKIPGLSKDRFIEIATSNHYCMTPGNYLKEIEHLCDIVDIKVERMDL